jgi:hypothetical protein
MMCGDIPTECVTEDCKNYARLDVYCFVCNKKHSTGV